MKLVTECLRTLAGRGRSLAAVAMFCSSAATATVGFGATIAPALPGDSCTPAGSQMLLDTNASGDNADAVRGFGLTSVVNPDGRRIVMVNVGNNIQGFHVVSPTEVVVGGMTSTGLSSGGEHGSYKLSATGPAAVDGYLWGYFTETGGSTWYLNTSQAGDVGTMSAARLPAAYASRAVTLNRLGDGRVVLCGQLISGQSAERDGGLTPDTGNSCECWTVSSPGGSQSGINPATWTAYHSFGAVGAGDLLAVTNDVSIDADLAKFAVMNVPGSQTNGFKALVNIENLGATKLFFEVGGQAQAFSHHSFGRIATAGGTKTLGAIADSSTGRFHLFEFLGGPSPWLSPIGSWVQTPPGTSISFVRFAGPPALLLVGNAASGGIIAYDLTYPTSPVEAWTSTNGQSLEDWWHAYYNYPYHKPQDFLPLGLSAASIPIVFSSAAGNVYTTALPCTLSGSACGFSYTTGSVYPGQSIAFTPRSAATSYSWNFGDGSPAASGANVAHAYAEPGAYQVTLTTVGPNDACTQTVTIATPNVTAIVAPANALTGQTVLAATQTHDGTPTGSPPYDWLIFDQDTITNLAGSVATTVSGSPTGPSWNFKLGTAASHPLGYQVCVDVRYTSSYSRRSCNPTRIHVGANAADFNVSPTNPTVGIDLTLLDATLGSVGSYCWTVVDTVSGATIFPQGADVGCATAAAVGSPLVIPKSRFTACAGGAACYRATLTVGTQPLSGGLPAGEVSSMAKSFTMASFCNSGVFSVLVGSSVVCGDSSPSGNTDCIGRCNDNGTIVVGNSVTFLAGCQVGGTGYYWDFGDGSSPIYTSSPSVAHSFSTEGVKKVKLTVNGSYPDTVCVDVDQPIICPVDYSYSPASPIAGQPVSFTNLTPNVVASNWTFQGGSPPSSNATHSSATWTFPGTYSVSLEASCINGGSGLRQKLITVTPPPTCTAAFTRTPSFPKAGVPVQFTDTTSGGATARLWSFPGGTPSTSTAANPIVTFFSPGTYAVTLTSTCSGSGTSVATQNVVVSTCFSSTGAYPDPPYGPTLAVVTTGSLGLYGRGRVLVAVDLSTPAAPIVRDEIEVPGFIDQSIVTNGAQAFVALGPAGVAIVDVSDPMNLFLLGTYEPPNGGSVHGLALDGSTLYVAAGAAGLRIVNVVVPGAPLEIGALASLGFSRGVAAAGNVAFLADGGGGFRVIDVTYPAAPSELAQLPTAGSSEKIWLEGTLAYVAEGASGLRILDVASPQNPLPVAAVDTPGWTESIRVSGSTAYLADGPTGVQRVDVSDPSNPTLLAPLATHDYAVDVALAGSHVLAADFGAGLRIVDLAALPSPAEVAALDTIAESIDVVRQGNTAYVARGVDGLAILNLTNPSNPLELAVIDTPGAALAIAVSGTRAFVADGEAGLRIFDVANPAAPYALGFFDTPRRAIEVALRANWAYVADDTGGLRILDVTNPAAPAEVGFWQPPDRVTSVVVDGRWAYVGNGARGIRVVDVLVPAAPVEVSFVDTPGQPVGLALSPPRLFVADENGGLRVISISNPLAISEVGSSTQILPTLDVELAGSMAAVAAGDGGLVTVDIANPAAPTVIEAHGTGGWANELSLVGTGAVVAEGGWGLELYDLAGCCSAAPPVPTLSLPPNGSLGQNCNARLDWSDPTGATSYDVYLATSNPPTTKVASALATSWLDRTLASGGTYYWKVVALSACGSSTSSVFSFSTGSPPTFALLSPANTAVNQPIPILLDWQDVTGVESYDLYLGTATTPPLFQTGIVASQVTVSGLAPATLYYWKVSAKNGCGSSSSTKRSFTTATSPLSVPDGSVRVTRGAGSAVTVAWGASCAASVDYEIHEGNLDLLAAGTFSHTTKVCSDAAGDRQESFTPSSGNRYYLVVPRSATGVEGGFGAGLPQGTNAAGCAVTGYSPGLCP